MWPKATIGAEGPPPAKRACLPQGLALGARSAPFTLVKYNPGQYYLASYCQMRCRTVNMIERHIKGGQKTIAYKQLGLSMDIETKVVQHVSSPKESDLTTLHTYSICENIVFLVFLFFAVSRPTPRRSEPREQPPYFTYRNLFFCTPVF